MPATAGGRLEWSPIDPDGQVIADELGRPSAWTRPARIVVAPAVDLFDGRVGLPTIEAVIGVIASTPDHAYMICTSRAKRLLALGNDGLRFPTNLGLGVPVSQPDDVWRVEDLLRCNTARPWVRLDGGAEALARLPLGMLSLVVTETGRDGLDQIRIRCRAAGVALEEW